MADSEIALSRQAPTPGGQGCGALTPAFAETSAGRLEEIANAAFCELADIGNGFLVYHCFDFEGQHIIASSAMNDGAIEMTLDLASKVIGYLPSDVVEAIEKALAEKEQRKLT